MYISSKDECEMLECNEIWKKKSAIVSKKYLMVKQYTMKNI